jgi:hypothetical protein
LVERQRARQRRRIAARRDDKDIDAGGGATGFTLPRSATAAPGVLRDTPSLAL